MENEQKSTGGYGKRPIWQWVVIYVIGAAIVYGLIYYGYVYFKHRSNSSNFSGTSTQQNSIY